MGRNRKSQPLPRVPLLLGIEKLSHEGRGIAHLDGKVVFVDEALPGEEVKVLYRSRKNSFDEAVTVEVLRASPHRVEALCPHTGLCGGCSLQHIDSAAQLGFKEAMLHEKLLHSVGSGAYRRLEAITGPAFHYRRKARLAVRYIQKKAAVLVGFRERLTPYITDMDSCAVLDPLAGRLFPLLAPLVRSLDSYREVPQIEIAVGDEGSDGGPAIAMVLRHRGSLKAADLARLDEFAAARQVDLYLQSGGSDSVIKRYPAGTPERLYYRLPAFGLRMAFHPLDFTQVNAEVNRLMLARAVELLQVGENDRVLDLFCGLGNFTLPLATRAAHVTGVEGVGEMVRRGRENAEGNGIENVAFHCADLARGMAGEAWMSEAYDKVVLDPPRSGAEQVLPAVMACRPRKILYISCNPSTLARDAAILQAGGYALEAAGVMDMFPQTTHVESMALFTAL